MSKTPISASYGLTLYGTDGQYHSQPASAPSAPTAVTVGATTTSSAAISWTASIAGTYSIAGYYVLVNGTLAATVSSGTSTTLTGLSAGTSYTVTVEAYDSQGTPLVSAASSPVTATTASASGTGTFTPATGVLAAIYGNTLSSSPIAGITTGTVLQIQLTSSFASAPSGVGAKPNGALPAYYYPFNSAYGLSTHPTLSRNQRTLTPTNTTYGAPAVTTSMAAPGETSCVAWQPNAGGTSGSAYANHLAFSQSLATFSDNLYVFRKVQYTFIPNNVKMLRTWESDTTYNSMLIGQGWGQGNTWATDNSLGGAVMPSNATGNCGQGSSVYPGNWFTQEFGVIGSTINVQNGVQPMWFNGYVVGIGVSEVPTNSLTGVTWETKNTAYPNPQVNLFGDEFTINQPDGLSAVNNGAWQAGTAYTAGTSVIVFTPYCPNYQQVALVCTTSGTSGTTNPGLSVPASGNNTNISDGTCVWSTNASIYGDYSNPMPMAPLNQTGASGLELYYGVHYCDDSQWRIMLSTETSWNVSTLLPNEIFSSPPVFSNREIQIPTYVDGAGQNFNFSVRRGSFTSGNVTLAYVIDVNNAGHEFGSMTWN